MTQGSRGIFAKIVRYRRRRILSQKSGKSERVDVDVVCNLYGCFPRQRCKVELHPFFAHDSFSDEFRIGITNCGQDIRFQKSKDFNNFDVSEQRGLKLSLSLKRKEADREWEGFATCRSSRKNQKNS